MNKKILFALWGGLFCLCAGLGFIPEPTGFLKALLVTLSLAFFVPGFLLLGCGRMEIQLVRNLAALALGITVLLLIGNFLSVMGSQTLGDILHYVLIILSAPMVCSQYWVLSLFLWACLLFAAQGKLKK